MSLSEDQIRRYSRHILLPDVGGRGQQRLLAGAVRASVGPGRIGELVALTYLAAAGVGTLVLDGDSDGCPTADELRWGIVFDSDDAERSRLDAIRERLVALNPDVDVVTEGPATAHALDDVAPATDLAAALVAGGVAAARAMTRLIEGQP